MSQERDRIDRASAERMLDAIAARPDADWSASEPLLRVLAAAAAPATEDELAGVEAAVAAFREQADAGAAPARSPRKVAAGSLPLVRLLPVKVAIAALAVTAAGGIALASATDTLPMPSVPGNEPSSSPSQTAPAMTGQLPHGAMPTAPLPSRSPGRDIVQLCEAYKMNPGQAQRNPALVAAAGGRGNVHGYCVKVLDQAGKPRPVPSGSSAPSPATPPSVPPSSGAKRKPAKPPAARTPQPPAPGSPSVPANPDVPGKKRDQHRQPDIDRPSPARS